MNKVLKELFSVYKYFPVGVMLFKDKKLFFVNDHLRNVLLLASLPSEHIIEIISNLLGLEKPSHHSLHEFLLHNNCFLHRNSIIQIEHKSVDNIDLFILIKISNQTIETIDSTQLLRSLQHENTPVVTPHLINEEWRLLINVLGEQFEKRKFTSIVLYKEIPIKADCRVVNIKEGMIELSIAKRQLIATDIGQEWLLGDKEDKMISGKVESYDLQSGKIWLSNLTLVSKGFHLRNDIRYTIEENGYFITSIKKEKKSLQLHDLSEKGLSVRTDDSTVLLALSALIGKTLNAEVSIDTLHLQIKAIPLHIEATDIPGMMKASFKIAYDSHNETLLHHWTINAQINLIKKVQNFVQMISAQNTDIQE